MVSNQHEAWLEPIRRRPELAADLLARALDPGVQAVAELGDRPDAGPGLRLEAVPAFADAALTSARTNHIMPVESEADSVVLLTNADGERVLVIVVEVQRAKNRLKRYVWPFYVASLRRTHRCDVTLLVLAPDPGVATWCARPIRLGHPGLVLTPLVIGPALVPVIVDPEEAARNPELAVLAAFAHGNDTAGDVGVRVITAALASIAHLDNEVAELYFRCIFHNLRDPARAEMEAQMPYELGEAVWQRLAARAKAAGEAEGRAEGKAQGKAEGKAEGKEQGKVDEATRMLLMFLGARGMRLSESIRERITTCTDLGQLEEWGRRAATADPSDPPETLFA